MRKTIIKCKTIGSVFMTGSDKGTAEIRSASIKGVMRFFWRAAQCAPNICILKEKEGALFGTVNKDARASSMRLSVRIEDKIVSQKADLLPHRMYLNRGTAHSVAVKPDTSFEVIISTMPKNERYHDEFVNLFILTTILGGFGKRSRKGMGNIKIQSITDSTNKCFDFSNDMQNLCALLTSISVLNNASYIQNGTGITVKTTTRPTQYPYIKKISISSKIYESSEEAARSINLAAHNAKKGDNRANFIGAFGKERFASPIICSVILDEKYFCIVTELNNTKYRAKEEKIRGEFLSEIL